LSLYPLRSQFGLKTRLRLRDDFTSNNYFAWLDLESRWSAFLQSIARHNALTFKQAAAGSKKKYIQTNLHIYVTLLSFPQI
jgi:hypothetical protein